MRRIVSLSLICMGLVGFATSAAAEKRVALVIGNGAYQSAPRLPNSRNDAEDVAASLQRGGFETILGLDLDKAGMDEHTIRFARAARTADVAIFYYSGHALQFAGINYLVPVDGRLTDGADLRRLARVDEIVADLQQASNVRILVLDACRDNPFVEQLKRSLGTTRALPLQRGLAKMDSPQGMIIAYATQAGRTADDGAGRNSPYTAAFLTRIEEQEEIGTVFRRISADVYRATRQTQLPELSLSLIGDFYLRGRPPVAAVAAPEAPTAATGPCAAAERHWSSAEAIGSRVALEDHLSRYPNCAFAGLAQAKIAGLSPTVGPASSDALQPTAAAEPSSNAAAVVPSSPQAGGLFTAHDAQRVKSLAVQKEFPPLPRFKLSGPDSTAPVALRKFIGIWASEIGFGGGGRHAMLIVTAVDAQARATGYWIWGPPAAGSRYRFEKGSNQFGGRIAQDQLTFQGMSYVATASFSDRSRLFLEQKNSDGNKVHITLEPVWRLVEAERLAKPAEGPMAAVEARLGPSGGPRSAELDVAAIDSRALAETLQRELKRVGCYAGSINGDWDQSSRAALARFNDHAKMALATDTPEPQAASVLRGVSARACPELPRSLPKQTLRKPAEGKLDSQQGHGASYGKPQLRGLCKDGNMDHCRVACSNGVEAACRRLRNGR